MTIYKDYLPGNTRLSGAEFKGLSELLRPALLPGLITTNSNLGGFTLSGGEITMRAFAAGDMIMTGGAGCTEYFIATFDFATAGPSGGPLPDGTYDIYLRVDPSGLSSKTMKCWPCATTQDEAYDVDDEGDTEAKFVGTVDETRYLIVRTGMVWDSGAGTLSAGADARAGKYGLIDLLSLGRGDLGTIILGAGRDVQITGDLEITGDLDVDDIVASSVYAALVKVGSGLDTGGSFIANPGSGFTFYDGCHLGFHKNTEITVENGTDLATDPGMTLAIGQFSSITIPANSKLIMDNNSLGDITGDITIQNAGTMTFKPGGLLIIQDGDSVDIPDQTLATTPEPTGFYGAQLPRAIAYVNASGTLLWGFNVDSITHTGSSGDYDVNFKREITGDWCAVATVYGAGSDCDVGIAVQTNASTKCTVRTREHAITVSGTPPDTWQHTVSALDIAFMVVCYGGTLAS